jgi:iron complex outermembrane receptor protein
MKRLMLLLAIVTIMYLILPGMSFAEGQNDVIQMNDVVVTATKTEKKAIDVSEAITVITGKQIEEIGAMNARDAIQYFTPSVYPESYGYEGGVTKIRGFTGNDNQVKVLIDSIPQLKESHGARFECIPAEQIERIEVIRGPSSVLYGSGAMGGVINIITKKKAIGNNVSLKTMLGPDSTRNVGVAGSLQKNDTGISIFANKDETDGWRKHTAHTYDNIRLSLSSVLDPESLLTLSSYYHRTYSEYGGGISEEDFKNDPETSYANNWDHSEEERWGLAPIYQTNLTDKIELVASGHFDKLIRSSFTSSEYIYDSDGEGLEFQVNFKHLLLGRKNILTVGIAGEREGVVQDVYRYTDGQRGDLTKIVDVEVLSGAVYLQDDLWITDRLNMVLGGRYERFDYTQDFRLDSSQSDSSQASAFVPKIGVTYKLTEDTSIYGNAGYSFQYPRWWTLVNNADIDPEEGQSYEIGVKGLLWEKFSYAVAFYQAEIDNKIETNTEWEEYSRNVGDIRNRGIELEVDYEVFSGFNIGITYAWLDSEIVKSKSNPEYDGNKTDESPENQVGCRISYLSPLGLSAAIAVNWVDESYIDDANELVLDDYLESMARVAYQWRNFSVGFVVNNLFDESYAKSAYSSSGEARYYPMPGRTCLVEFSVGI